jgi:hypothetical protein
METRLTNFMPVWNLKWIDFRREAFLEYLCSPGTGERIPMNVTDAPVPVRRPKKYGNWVKYWRGSTATHGLDVVEDFSEAQCVSMGCEQSASWAIHSLFIHKDHDLQNSSDTKKQCVSWTNSILANTRHIHRERMIKKDRHGDLCGGTFKTLTSTTTMASFTADAPKVVPYMISTTQMTGEPVVNCMRERSNHLGELQSHPKAVMPTVDDIMTVWKLLLPEGPADPPKDPTDSEGLSTDPMDWLEKLFPEKKSWLRPSFLFQQLLCNLQYNYHGLNSDKDWVLLFSRLCVSVPGGMESFNISDKEDLVTTTYWLFMKVVKLREAPLEGFGRIATTIYAMSGKFPVQWNQNVPPVSIDGRRHLFKHMPCTVYSFIASGFDEATMATMKSISARLQSESAQSTGELSNFADFLDSWTTSYRGHPYDPNAVQAKILSHFKEIADCFVESHLFLPNDEKNRTIAILCDLSLDAKQGLKDALSRPYLAYQGEEQFITTHKFLSYVVTILAQSYLVGHDAMEKSPSLDTFRRLIECNGNPDKKLGQDIIEVETKTYLGCDEDSGRYYSFKSMRDPMVRQQPFSACVFVCI